MKKIQITAVALGIILLVTSMPGAIAASTTKTTTTKTTTTGAKKAVVHTLANLSPVKITAKSTVRLTDVNILTQSDESILTYTLTIQNNDTKTMDLLDYWSKVKTVSGTTYSTSLMSKDKDKKKLSAGSSTTMTYVARIAKHLKPESLVFQVIKWDFSQAGYEALKGQFKIPAGYLTSTPSDQSKTLRITDTPVKAQVKQVASFVSGDYNYVSVSLDMTNIGYKLFEDPKYKFMIRTSTGASYPMSADPTSTEYKIQPQDVKTLNLVAQIPKTIKLENMELQLALDDETAKLTLPIATMQLPNISNTSLEVEPNVEKFIPVTNGKIAVRVTSAVVNKNFDEHSLSIRFGFRNTSGTTLTLPKYQFELQTSDGYRLPISAPALDSLTLQPLEERFITLPVTVPANVSVESPQLFMNLPSAAESTENISYPVAFFSVPEAKPVENMIGTKQFVQTKNGILGVTLSSLQRLPWSDGDLVSAKITIDNSNFKTTQLPELGGLVQVDSAKLNTDTKVIVTQTAGLLGAAMSTDVYVTAKVPSYLDFSQVQISLLEKFGEASSEWVQFSNIGAIPEPATVAKGQAYTIDTLGRQQDIRVMRSFLYMGQSSDLAYAELEVINEEDHQIDLSQFAGVFKTSNGLTYKASASQIDTSAGPKEKNVVVLWAKIPKRVTTTDMKVIVGEGITEDKLTPVKGEVQGYVNAASLELAMTAPNVRGNLSDLDLFPYALTVKTVKATLSGSRSVSLNFDYNLTRNMDYGIGEFEHKFLFEVVDSSSGRVFEKEFIPETDLRIASGGSASFNFDDVAFEDRKAGSFTLNVYDLFQGHKVKLGSQGFNYFSDIIEY
ncbi:hypothetical protein J41TS12_00880 [Paenibacillus antibioticophila]|uniref:Uncharacterized protein n=1 Tax=Paenibacillus antibioticophila TaxID=1274374 RepID=A0A919XR57_9BACL|nr:hypothetical protein [Paenibacillus antibioticophila]GIO35227.1 hypothetical protein J41TS12_00880 [Paenibacillus antibioticophila]